jgi:hypothetical protein
MLIKPCTTKYIHEDETIKCSSSTYRYTRISSRTLLSNAAYALSCCHSCVGAVTAAAVVCGSGLSITTVDSNGCGLVVSLALTVVVVYDCVESSSNDVGGPPSFYWI